MKESQEQAKLQKEKEELSEEVQKRKDECATMKIQKSETEKSHLVNPSNHESLIHCKVCIQT